MARHSRVSGCGWSLRWPSTYSRAVVPGWGSTRSALRRVFHSNQRKRSHASLRTVLLPMRAAFFCPHCAQNGPESAAPQFRHAWVSNSASLTVVGVGWGGRGITRKERRRPGWGGLRIVGCGPAAASDSRSSAHSARVGTAVAPTGGTLGAFTVKSQVAVGGLAGRGPTWYSQVLGRAGSSTMRTLPPQLPRTVLPTGSGGETAQTCWGPGTGKSGQVMGNAPGGLLVGLVGGHWAWALPAARQALTDTERNRATRKMRRRSFMGARLGKKWTMPPAGASGDTHGL